MILRERSKSSPRSFIIGMILEREPTPKPSPQIREIQRSRAKPRVLGLGDEFPPKPPAFREAAIHEHGARLRNGQFLTLGPSDVKIERSHDHAIDDCRDVCIARRN